MKCIAYVPNIYNGAGTTQTLVWMLENFITSELYPIIYFERTWQLPSSVESYSLYPSLLHKFPGKLKNPFQKKISENKFLSILEDFSPNETLIYLWPQPSFEFLRNLKDRGFCVIREMINCAAETYYLATEQARLDIGLPLLNKDCLSIIEDETRHIQTVDFVTAPNQRVFQSLLNAGISSNKILETSFGWDPGRFNKRDEVQMRKDDKLQFVFVGSINPRKGIYYLINAWREAKISGTLNLVGAIDPEVAVFVQEAIAHGLIKHTPYTTDIENLYRNSDVFVFPTVEEGGPQVTYEAAGCGLPVITTSMGAARLIEDGRNGLLVPEFDSQSLKFAMQRLSSDSNLRRKLGNQAAVDAQKFTYERVGSSRTQLFLEAFQRFQFHREL